MNNPDINLRVLELLRFAGSHLTYTEALARATGEHFNIFKILGIGHYEVKTHSPILGELLNPKGSHGQADAFLRLFVKQMEIPGFDTASARLELEHQIGRVAEESGGRIDIVILDGSGNAIFIENKIYAGDQEKQLQRYRKRNSQAALFYLTLEGSLPNGFTEESLKAINAIRISYKYHIRDWLMTCQKEAVLQPHVRETISQYLHLVRELTGQSTTQAMNNELIKRITADNDSLAAYFALTSEMEAVKSALVEKLEAQLDVVTKGINLGRHVRSQHLHDRYTGIYFNTESLTNHNLRMGFGFAKAGFQDLNFGFVKIDKEKPCEVKEKLLVIFQEQFPTFSPRAANEWWPAWADFESPYEYWGTEAFQAILSGELAANIKDKLVTMSKIAKQACPD